MHFQRLYPMVQIARLQWVCWDILANLMENSLDISLYMKRFHFKTHYSAQATRNIVGSSTW